jgi:hypothetical protein
VAHAVLGRKTPDAHEHPGIAARLERGAAVGITSARRGRAICAPTSPQITGAGRLEGRAILGARAQLLADTVARLAGVSAVVAVAGRGICAQAYLWGENDPGRRIDNLDADTEPRWAIFGRRTGEQTDRSERVTDLRRVALSARYAVPGRLDRQLSPSASPVELLPTSRVASGIEILPGVRVLRTLGVVFAVTLESRIEVAAQGQRQQSQDRTKSLHGKSPITAIMPPS